MLSLVAVEMEREREREREREICTEIINTLVICCIIYACAYLCFAVWGGEQNPIIRALLVKIELEINLISD